MRHAADVSCARSGTAASHLWPASPQASQLHTFVAGVADGGRGQTGSWRTAAAVTWVRASRRRTTCRARPLARRWTPSRLGSRCSRGAGVYHMTACAMQAGPSGLRCLKQPGTDRAGVCGSHFAGRRSATPVVVAGRTAQQGSSSVCRPFATPVCPLRASMSLIRPTPTGVGGACLGR